VWGACITPAAAGAATCGADSPSLTPADAVTLGATAAVQELVGWADGPELIISGVNRGGNDGLNVNISGTLGAATIGLSLGFPSIAISASSSGPAAANSQAAAEWAVGFVGTLTANDLLPTDYVLSVNYPRTDRAPITDAVWAPVAQMSPFATGYVRDGLSFESVFAFCAGGPRCGPAEPGSDSAVYSAGNIAVSPISVNRTAGATADVAAVRAVVESGAVSPVPPDHPGNRPIVVPPGQSNASSRPGR
jgi:5'-nucleotidase